MTVICHESMIKIATNIEGRLNVMASKCILNHETWAQTQEIRSLYL